MTDPTATVRSAGQDRITDSAADLDPAALTVAHIAVEAALVAMRDARISVMGPANGFVIKERDGADSSVIRLGTRAGLDIAIKAYLAAVAAPDPAPQLRPRRGAGGVPR